MSLGALSDPTASPPSPGVCTQGKPWHSAAKPGVWLLSLPMPCHSNACAWSRPIITLALHGILDLSTASGFSGHPGAVADPIHHPCPISAFLAGCCGIMLRWEGLPYNCLRFPKHKIHKYMQCKTTVHIK